MSFPVVGVGASAGGLRAMEEFFEAMPSSTKAAFVVITHGHPDRVSVLPELLARKCALPVERVDDGIALAPGHVYVAPGGATLVCRDDSLSMTEPLNDEVASLPIDSFFRSLATARGEQAIGIVLSGSGFDGTLGVQAIKGGSGMTMAQEPASAQYTAMPSSAIDTGQVDHVLPPAELAAALAGYLDAPYLNSNDASSADKPLSGKTLESMLAMLRERTGNAYYEYKESTVRRRIERRMSLRHLSDPRDYLSYLHRNPNECMLLGKELLIQVTAFFRDPQAFQALGRTLSDAVAKKASNDRFRVWVPGCSTGEEAYSVAMVLHEALEGAASRLKLQIYATDLDNQGVSFARAGLYPPGIVMDIDAARLERFFDKEGTGFRIRRGLRESIVFSVQNLISDPPFSQLDLVSCRNLLIYLNKNLQARLLPMFHYALQPGGLLFLGPSESVQDLSDLFEPADRKWKIFKRIPGPSVNPLLFRLQAGAGDDQERSAQAGQGHLEVQHHRFRRQIERLLMQKFVPPCVIVNADAEILYIAGRTGEFLEPSSGQPRLNVLDMARPGLRAALTAALRHAVAQSEEAVRSGVSVRSNGGRTTVDVRVTPLPTSELIRNAYLIALCPVQSRRPADDAPPPDAQAPGSRETDLEQELRETQESLRTTVEELEAANEELTSTNEELQSTNEEVETSREEMQSLNEELMTVNAELQSKLQELSQSNDDTQNLLDNTHVATIFLDEDLHITRFTNEARKIIKLIDSDIGRPIGDLVSNLEDDGLEAEAREVLDDLNTKETEVRTQDGHWYLMRIFPSRGAEKVVDGVVVTFVDIAKLKAAERVSQQRSLAFDVVETVRDPMAILDSELRVLLANRSFCDTFRIDSNDVVGRALFEIGDGQWNDSGLEQRLGSVIDRREEFEGFEVRGTFPNIGVKTLSIAARRLAGEASSDARLLLAIRDVTALAGKN